MVLFFCKFGYGIVVCVVGVEVVVGLCLKGFGLFGELLEVYFLLLWWVKG